MSGQTPNFFAVLSEPSTVVGTGAVHLRSSPPTASSTSSKKSDVNPRADPARAKPKPVGAPSNDRTLKESKNAGRANNQNVPVAQGASTHRSHRAERNDRASRSGKRDTAKRTRSGWGDKNSDAKDQVVGAEIAKEETSEPIEIVEGGLPAEESVPVEPKITFDQYMQSAREQAEALNTRKSSVKPAAAATPSASATTAATPEPRKKHSNKTRKAVDTLELDSSSAPPLLRKSDNRDDRDDRKPRDSRGPRSTGDRKFDRKPRTRGDKSSVEKSSDRASAKPRQSSGKPAINLEALPKLS